MRNCLKMQRTVTEVKKGEETTKRRAGMQATGVPGGDPRMSRIKTTSKENPLPRFLTTSLSHIDT